MKKLEMKKSPGKKGLLSSLFGFLLGSGEHNGYTPARTPELLSAEEGKIEKPAEDQPHIPEEAKRRDLAELEFRRSLRPEHYSRNFN